MAKTRTKILILFPNPNSPDQIEKQARWAEETAPSAVDEKWNHQHDARKNDTEQGDALHAEHAERLGKGQIDARIGSN